MYISGDGIFLFQKSQSGYILEGLGIKNVIIFNFLYLEYFRSIMHEFCMVIWYFPPTLVHILYQENSGNPVTHINFKYDCINYRLATAT
jgi:hypothetical protein